MTHTTHHCCNNRLAKQGGKALCCECSPHDCGEPKSYEDKVIESFDEQFNGATNFIVMKCLQEDNNETFYNAVGVVRAFIRQSLQQQRTEFIKEVMEGFESENIPVSDHHWTERDGEVYRIALADFKVYFKERGIN